LARVIGPVRLRRTVGVELGGALNLIGTLLKYLSLAFLFPTALALAYSESVWPFVGAGAACAGFGFLLEFSTRGKERIGLREGFLVVALTWLGAAFFVSVPYLLSGQEQLASPLDAYFEGMSGMTTTGASILTDIEGLPRALAMWRQFSQWLGGMGIIVLALAVLPRLRVGGRQLLESELPGPEIENLAARIRDTARRLWILYVGLTAAEIVALAGLGWTGVDERMSPYEAVAHAFTTMPTGGFSTQARSIEAFSTASQWVIVVFMVLAGANFALMYRGIAGRDARAFARDEEFRLYIGLLALGAVVITAALWTEGVRAGEEAVRHAVFQTVSMMTTTGYANADFNEWLVAAPLAAMVLVALMFSGGSAGSTSGSVKVVRHVVIGRVLRRELDQTVHAELVMPIRLNRRILDERTLRAIISFVLLYVGIFVVGSLALLIESHRAGVDVTPFEAITAAATTLGNVGPGLGFFGPMGSFDPFSGLSKAIMIVLMWVGRLELIPVVVLFSRSYWRV
jgi:trk system potassium uptake protein TrkH